MLEPVRFKIRVLYAGVVWAEAWEIDLDLLEAFIRLRDRLSARADGEPARVERARFDNLSPDRQTPIWRVVDDRDAPAIGAGDIPDLP